MFSNTQGSKLHWVIGFCIFLAAIFIVTVPPNEDASPPLIVDALCPSNGPDPRAAKFGVTGMFNTICATAIDGRFLFTTTNYTKVLVLGVEVNVCKYFRAIHYPLRLVLGDISASRILLGERFSPPVRMTVKTV